MFVHFLQASATNWQRSLSPLYRDSIISLTLKTFKLWQYNPQNEKYILKKEGREPVSGGTLPFCRSNGG